MRCLRVLRRSLGVSLGSGPAELLPTLSLTAIVHRHRGGVYKGTTTISSGQVLLFLTTLVASPTVALGSGKPGGVAWEMVAMQ